MEHEDKEVSLLALTAKLLLRLLHIFFQLAHGILQGCPSIVHLIHNQNILANQAGHLKRAQVQPLCAGDLGARNFLGVTTAQVLVEGQTDGLDRDVAVARALQEGSVNERYMRNRASVLER